MHTGFPLYGNKKMMSYQVTNGNKKIQALLEGFSLEELRILRDNLELTERIRCIADMTYLQLLAELKEEYDLVIDGYHNGDLYISIEKLEEFVPEWFETNHYGWFMTTAEFEHWAREFLMQEIRINLWLRYLEKKTKQKEDEAVIGMYL